MEASSTMSGSREALGVAASVAGLAGYVYVLGGVISWIRLSAAHLPGDVTTSLLDSRTLFAIGLRAIVIGAAGLTVISIIAYWAGRHPYRQRTTSWHRLTGRPVAGDVPDPVVRTVAGLNVLVIALVLGLGAVSFVSSRLPTRIVVVVFVLIVIAVSFGAAHVGEWLFFGRARKIVAVVLVAIALLCQTPIAILVLTSVAIAELSRVIAGIRRPTSLTGFFHSPLPWALGAAYGLVAIAFVATPPVTYPRALVTTAGASQIGGYIARTSDGVYLGTCTAQANGLSSAPHVQLIRDADVRGLTLGGMPYRFDSGDRPALLTLILRAFGANVSWRGLVHVELRARQPTCDAAERATGGADQGLGAGVLTGPAPPGGRAAGGEPTIRETSPAPLAQLALRYQPTVEVTVADRFWPVSVSSVLAERGAARGDTVCLMVGGTCTKRSPTLHDLTPRGGADDSLNLPAQLTDDPTQQFLAYARGQGISEHDALDWVNNPLVLDPWQSAQVYFYYAGSADGIARYGDIPSGLLALQYWFFYPFNYYPTDVERGLMLASPLAGDHHNTDLHEGDWEHVTVLVDSSPPYAARFVYFARHDTEGETVSWSDSRLHLDGTHPIVQGAFGGHPSYPNTCAEHPRAALKDQSSDWVICATGRYGFRAQSTPLVDLARTTWACWPGHFGEATPAQIANAKLPETNPRRWEAKVVRVAGPRSPLWQAENASVCRRGPGIAEAAHPIR